MSDIVEPSTTEITVAYIKAHPHIRSCLKNGLVNFSALARKIAKELQIEKKTSKEAILIAARRFRDKLKKEEQHDKEIQQLLSSSEVDLRTKIVVFILAKSVELERLDAIHKQAHLASGIFFLLEGSESYTLIIQERFAGILRQRCGHAVLRETKNLALATLRSSRTIENVPGVIAYLTALFAENGVNIVEFLSCWTDTLFVVHEKDLHRVLSFLRF